MIRKHSPQWILAATFAAVLLVPTAALAADADCDGIEDSVDNCPDRFNPDQANLDGDADGDRCDADKDGDAVDNAVDNCPKVVNALQEDSDADGVGDACDQCAEAADQAVNKRGCSVDQLCPCDGPNQDRAWKNQNQYLRCVRTKARDFRRRGFVDADGRRAIVDAARASSCGAPVPAAGDNDGDGVADDVDNCPSDSNPSQRNSDGDGFGDACDTDKDDDTVLNAADNCPIVANTDGQSDDADADTVGDACDACVGTAASTAVDNDGCSLDQYCPCDLDDDGNAWASHGKYVRCYTDAVFRFRLLHIVTGEEAEALRMAARATECGQRPPVCE